MYEADKSNFILGAHTGAGKDSTYNICNIACGHAYSILAVFEIKLSSYVYPVIMVRNPWGHVQYNQSLN